MMICRVAFLFLLGFFAKYGSAYPMEEIQTNSRTISSQQSMNCNSRSSARKIIMSNLNDTTVFRSRDSNCRYAIRAYNLNVCQLRIDFHFFNLAQPQPNGTIEKPFAHCIDEYLSIDGLDFNLCGLLNNQHLYINWDVKRTAEEKILNFQIQPNSQAMWFMEANQIECTHKSPIVIADEREAPNGCLQYFYKSSGLIQSFNYGSIYFGNNRYAICFDRKQNNNAVLVLTEITFKMSGTNFDDSCLKDVHDENLSEDYISMPHAEIVDRNNVWRHNLFCGDSLNSKVVELNANGPIVIQVNTDNKTNIGSETGFRFRYNIRTR